MKNKKIHILIGVPASGKSTYIENNKKEGDVVFSSDGLRKELLGDENIQSNNSLVFSTLFERLEKEIKKNKNNIYIDATNISNSDRRKTLNIIRNVNKNKLKDGADIELKRIKKEKIEISKEEILKKYFYKNYDIIGINFEVNLETAILRDKKRERTVGENVIMKIFTRYDKPELYEGFDEIINIKNNNYKLEKEFIDELKIFLYTENYDLRKILEKNYYLNYSIDCEQTSKWHQESLLKHLNMILKLIEKNKNNFSEQYLKILKLLTIFHDIGKPFTKNRKKYNLERRGYKYLGKNKFKKKNGEIIEYENIEDFQFLNHEDLSTNLFNLLFKKALIENKIITDKEAEIIEIIIKGHLIFHQNNGEKIKINNNIYSPETEIFKIGTLFSYFDGKGRVGRK